MVRDPKGYYIALGISEDADADSIKSAYRNKAKRLHPDFNPSPIAAKQFHRLHEAYQTLSDTDTRAAYDRPWRFEQPKTNGAHAYTRAEAQRDPPQKERPSERSNERPRGTGTESHAESRPKPAADQPATCRCGKITAQPRYIIFDLVWGRLNKVQRRGVSGIFCRSCADRTAIRASLITWLAGWWAWPSGPKETVKALVSNIRGGRKPADRNARLLMRQARAFRARGEMELARNAAEQALAFAATPSLRHDVDSLLLTLSAHPARALKDRWAKPGWAATAQVLPLAAIVGVLSMIGTMLAPLPLSIMAQKFITTDLPLLFAPKSAPGVPAMAPVQTGRVYSVSVKQASLRTGPGTDYQLLALLNLGMVVLVMEADPSGQWLRVTTPDGASGFIAAAQLSPDVRIDALEDIGGFGKPARPDEAMPPAP